MQSDSLDVFLDTFQPILNSSPHIFRVLLIGDIIGRTGRKIVKNCVPQMRQKLGLHFVCANGENVAGGFGITEKTFVELRDHGVDFVTMGNHWKDKPDIHNLVKTSDRIMLPLNLEPTSDLQPWAEVEISNGNLIRKIGILNFMGNFAMKDSYGNPFQYIEKKLELLKQQKNSGQYIFLADVHGEASSEKQAIFWYLDGILSALVGTHTHTPTSDERISHKGTALLTDLGMTGGYHSIIGMTIEGSQRRYFTPLKKQAQEVAEQDPWFCGFLVEIDGMSGKSLAAHRLQFRMKDGKNGFRASSV